MAPAPSYLLTSLLRDVSRSFYLTLRVLPASIRPQIGLAYLLARTTDTIADTELVAVAQRLEALTALGDAIQTRRAEPLNFGTLLPHQSSLAEKVLLQRVDETLGLLNGMDAADQQLVRAVLDIITSGQRLDLRRFAGASATNVIALARDEELDDYTYRVAGCVGEFWTKMCRAHVFPRAALDDRELIAKGIRFGKGLQLVNILRDLPDDLRKGRCYLPAKSLANHGLKPADLLAPANEGRLRPVYDMWLQRAQEHLAIGWRYTNLVPRGCIRVRLACAWPLLIGRDTLHLLRGGPILDPQRRIKVSRSRVRRTIRQTILCYPFRQSWEALFDSV